MLNNDAESIKYAQLALEKIPNQFLALVGLGLSQTRERKEKYEKSTDENLAITEIDVFNTPREPLLKALSIYPWSSHIATAIQVRITLSFYAI